MSTETMELVSTNPVSFEDLLGRANDIQDKCSDYMVSKANSLNTHVSSDSCNLIYRPDGEEPVRSVQMSPFAMGQLCTKLGIPTRYIEKCISNGMIDLASDNFNEWMSNFNRSLFIREYDGKARGILSDRYMTLDTPNILEVLQGTFDNSPYSIKGSFISPERFHLRVVQKEMLRINNEDLFAGIQIDSSDVGRSTLVAKFMIFKQVCTNGLCITKGGGILFSQRHIGTSKREFRDDFVSGISRVPELIEMSESFIRESMKPDEKYRVDHFSSEQMTQLIDKVRSRTSLSEESTNKVIDLMRSSYTPSRWGLINGITEVAQEFSLERRLQLEDIAGNILLSA